MVYHHLNFKIYFVFEIFNLYQIGRIFEFTNDIVIYITLFFGIDIL
jgi:hypothetical protein